MAIRTNGQQAAAKLIDLVKAFKRVASGVVEQQVAEDSGRQIDAIGKSKLRRHIASGTAQGEWEVTTNKALRIKKMQYLGYHKWWPFRGKRLPMAVLRKIAVAYRMALAEQMTSVGGDKSDRDLSKVLGVEA